MKIIGLKSENVKRLRAVEITPDGSTVIIGGQNGQGKSSVLDSIAYALGGEKLIPAEPLRRGEQSGRAEVRLDGDPAKGIPPLVVERRFSASGATSLSIKAADGSMKISSPQSLLNSLCGKIAFDPLEFSRMKPADQAATLKKLVGLDFAKLDADRKKLYDERTEVNREVKRLEGALASTPQHPDAPAEEVAAAELIGELKQRQELANRNNEERQKLRDLAAMIDAADREEAALMEEISRLQRKLAERQAASDALRLRHAEQFAVARSLTDPDVSTVEARIFDVDAVNAKVRANQARAKLASEIQAAKARSDDLTRKIDRIDSAKELQLQSAAWPVDGLGFDADGITFNGLPFEQASSAEQLRVSVAIGLALNPTLRVLLIRDGSLLDDRSLAMVAEMATAADGQVWIERVSDGTECSVVIEDGTVRQVAATAV